MKTNSSVEAPALVRSEWSFCLSVGNIKITSITSLFFFLFFLFFFSPSLSSYLLSLSCGYEANWSKKKPWFERRSGENGNFYSSLLLKNPARYIYIDKKVELRICHM